MTRSAWKQFICRACGLIYDEEVGDPDSGIAPGTRFKDIPDDWVCPLCGVVKADFEPYELESEPCDAVALSPVGRRASRAAGVVIVGAGHAGWAAAQALRHLDQNIAITIVTACRGDKYLKPELSIALSRGATAETLVRETAQAAAEKLKVRVLPDTFVVGISPNLGQVRTTRGNLHFTDLIIAQGARPSLPKALPPGLCWRINDLEGWSGLQQKIGASRKRLLIVGAGLVGCELADDFTRAGHQVILLDVQSHPLAGLLPEVAALRVERGLEKAGVLFMGSLVVSSVTKNADGSKRVETECGKIFEADEVVAATGLVTDARLARGAALAFNRGIVVDPQTLQTSMKHVFALGDCVSIEGAPCRFIEPIAKQADAIAHAILKLEHVGYEHAAPVIRVKTKSIPVLLHGAPLAAGQWAVREDQPELLVMEQILAGNVISKLEVGAMAGRRRNV